MWQKIVVSIMAFEINDWGPQDIFASKSDIVSYCSFGYGEFHPVQLQIAYNLKTIQQNDDDLYSRGKDNTMGGSLW